MGSEWSSQRMIHTMGEMEFEDFKASLLASRSPFSLICDGSSDAADIHVMACLVQYTEHNVVVVRLYRMIEIDVDESAAALVSLLEEHMREDGIWEHAVEFLVSMATDGASVMLGKENGF